MNRKFYVSHWTLQSVCDIWIIARNSTNARVHREILGALDVHVTIASQKRMQNWVLPDGARGQTNFESRQNRMNIWPPTDTRPSSSRALHDAREWSTKAFDLRSATFGIREEAGAEFGFPFCFLFRKIENPHRWLRGGKYAEEFQQDTIPHQTMMTNTEQTWWLTHSRHDD